MTTSPAVPGPGPGHDSPPAPQARRQPGPGDDSEMPGAAAGPGQEEEIDVLYLAGQRLPGKGAWLLVTGVDGAPGSHFTAQVLDDDAPWAHGGDVIVRLTPADPPPGQPPPAVLAQVQVVLGGRLIPVASWPGQNPDLWPEQIRPAVAFAMGMLTELEEHAADLGPATDLAQAAAGATAGVPLHITFPAGTTAPLLP